MDAVEPHVAWYIATVWMGPDPWALDTRKVVRLPAVDEDDYRRQVRAQVDQAFARRYHVAFGTVSRSKVQR
jgi:hypothetical protein